MEDPEAKRLKVHSTAGDVLSEKDKKILRSWSPWTNVEQYSEDMFRTWSEEQYLEAYSSWLDEHQTTRGMRDSADCPLRGGSVCSEKIDDFYEHFFVETILEDGDPITKCRIIKMLKGLHKSPEIPCVENSHGFVTISLDAMKQYLSAYFDTPCELKDGEKFDLLFGLLQEEGLQTAQQLVVASLSSFREKTISPRAPLFLSSSPLPLFTITGINDGRHGSALVGGGPCVPASEVPQTQGLGLSTSDSSSKGAGPVDEPELSSTLEQVVAALQSVRELEIVSLEDPRKIVSKRNKALLHEADEIGSMAEREYTAVRARYGKFEHCSNLKGITTSDMARLYRRAGVLTEADYSFETMREAMLAFMEDAIVKAGGRSVKLLTVDTIIASRPKGLTAIGFGGAASVRCVWSSCVYRVLQTIHPMMKVAPKAMSVMNDLCTFALQKVMSVAKDLRNEQQRFEGNSSSHVEDSNEEGEEDDDRAFWSKEYNAGGSLHEGSGLGDGLNARLRAGLSGAYKVRLYQHKGCGCNEKCDKLAVPVAVITSQDVQLAVRQVMGKELAKHAISEATKAITKDYGIEKARLSSVAALDFDPEHVALISGRLVGDFPLSEGAAVFAAAVLEYMCAEIVDLAGRTAKDDGKTAITCHDVQLAIRNDEELASFFFGCVLREGGVLPGNIHICRKQWGCEELTPFERLMVSKVRTAAAASDSACGAFVDPRTGLHIGIVEVPHYDDSLRLRPLPLLDALSKEGQRERQLMAQAALSEAERAAMKAEGYRVIHDDDSDAEAQGWARESLAALMSRNGRENLDEMRSTRSIFPHSAFNRLAQEICLKHHNLRITAEAFECLQMLTEAFLIGLAEDANDVALHSWRTELQSRDLSVASKIRADRGY